MAAKWGKKQKGIVGGATPPAASEPARISNKLEHTLVAESKIDKKQQLKSRLNKVTSHRRFKPAAIALVAIVVVAGALLFVTRDKNEPVAQIDDGPKCSYPMLEKAKSNFEPKKFEELQKQAKDIEQIPGYDTDVNCLYVVTTYYLNAGNVEKSREFYEKLNAVYDASEGYETILRDVASEPKQIKAKVEFLEAQKKSVEKYGKKFKGGGLQVNPETGEPVR